MRNLERIHLAFRDPKPLRLHPRRSVRSSPCKQTGRAQNREMDFAEIYLNYYRRVYRWCFRIVRNREDAEDLTQDTFVQVMRKIHTFRGDASLSTWLYSVARNTALMRLRRKRLPQSSLDEEHEFGEGSSSPYNSFGLADHSLGDPDARIDLTRAVEQLPRGFKAALLLHDLEDYTHSEIARYRGWTTGTSKSQVHKARFRMRELLGDASRGRGSVVFPLSERDSAGLGASGAAIC